MWNQSWQQLKSCYSWESLVSWLYPKQVYQEWNFTKWILQTPTHTSRPLTRLMDSVLEGIQKLSHNHFFSISLVLRKAWWLSILKCTPFKIIPLTNGPKEKEYIHPGCEFSPQLPQDISLLEAELLQTFNFSLRPWKWYAFTWRMLNSTRKMKGRNQKSSYTVQPALMRKQFYPEVPHTIPQNCHLQKKPHRTIVVR